MAINFRNVIGVGVGIGVTSWLLRQVYGFFTEKVVAGGLGTATFSALPLQPLDINVQNQILAGVNTELGPRLLTMLSGGTIGELPALFRIP